MNIDHEFSESMPRLRVSPSKDELIEKSKVLTDEKDSEENLQV